MSRKLTRPVGKPLRKYQANPNSIPRFLPPLPFFEGSMDEPPRVSQLLAERMLTYRPNGPKVTQQELADCMNVSRLSVNELLNDKRNLTADMALRLERVFGGDPEARWWLQAQSAHDLWEVRKIKVYVRKP